MIWRGTAIATIVAGSFCYGFATDRYHLPPYKLVTMLSGRISEDPRPARAQFFRALKSNPAVVMLGDSRTHQGDWAELFGSSRVVNRGISGDTTDGILGRIDEVTSREPRLVVMLIGVNDLRNKSPEYVANNVYMILSKLRSAGINVLI